MIRIITTSDARALNLNTPAAAAGDHRNAYRSLRLDEALDERFLTTAEQSEAACRVEELVNNPERFTAAWNALETAIETLWVAQDAYAELENVQAPAAVLARSAGHVLRIEREYLVARYTVATVDELVSDAFELNEARGRETFTTARNFYSQKVGA